MTEKETPPVGVEPDTSCLPDKCPRLLDLVMYFTVKFGFCELFWQCNKISRTSNFKGLDNPGTNFALIRGII